MPIIQEKIDTALQRAIYAKQEADDAQQDADAAQQIADAAQQMADAVQQTADATQQTADAAQEIADAAQQRANIAQLAADKAKAIISLMTHLYDLATDCLRLSMYFFHPIQLCAQQVYHSALPLSPISSQLRKYSLQSVIDNQLSHVVAFSGAPDNWGLLLRTIDVRTRQITCIATSIQRIVAACENVVSIYNAVTGVPIQSLYVPETVIKIQDSPDGSILFFSHSYSVTMWDVQTGGLIHTFTTQSGINDIAVSTTGDHIACGLSNGSIVFWNIHTKEENRCSGDGQPIVSIHWPSSLELIIATQNSVYYICDITVNKISNCLDRKAHV